MKRSPRPPGAKAYEPPKPTTEGSITRLKEMTPIRLATQRPLEDGQTWSGFELTTYRVSTSLYGGPHFLIKLGHSGPAGFVPMFCLRWSCTARELNDDAMHDQVHATAGAYLLLLNTRRAR